MTKCRLCGKEHEQGTPHPLSPQEMAFWGDRIYVQEIHVQTEIVESIEKEVNEPPRKRGRPRSH